MNLYKRSVWLVCMALVVLNFTTARSKPFGFLQNDLLLEYQTFKDFLDQKFYVSWPKGVSKSGFEESVKGSWVTEHVLVHESLLNPKHRQNVYSNLIFALCTQPALNEDKTQQFFAALQLIEQSNLSLDEFEKYALAFQVISEQNLRFIKNKNAFTRVINDIKTYGRHMRQIQRGSNFAMAQHVLAGVSVAMTSSDIVVATFMLNSLMSDEAIRRLDWLSKQSLRDCGIDPAFYDALNTVKSQFKPDLQMQTAFFKALMSQAPQITQTGADVGIHVWAHKAALAAGAKAGIAVSLYAIPVAITITTYFNMLEITSSIQHALLAAVIAQDFQLLPTRGSQRTEQSDMLQEMIRYSHYEFYAQMKQTFSGELVWLASQIYDDIKDLKDKYIYREKEARALLVPSGPAGEANTDKRFAGFILDSSGSMQDNDPQDIRKQAMKLILTNLENELDAYIVDFDDGATLLNDGNTRSWNRQQLMQSIDRIDSNGGTDVGAGLSLLRSHLEHASPLYEQGAIVLLSDGIGDYNQEATWFAQARFPVYTISLAGDANAKLMTDIAALTGGEYIKAATSKQIVEAFNRFFSVISGKNRLASFQGSIKPQQNLSHSFVVEANAENIFPVLSWPGSRIDLELVDPDGKRWNPSTAKTLFAVSENLVTATIEHPRSGTWKALLTGTDVPAQGEPYSFEVFGKSDFDVQLDFKQDLLTYQGGALNAVIDWNQQPNVQKALVSVETPTQQTLDLSQALEGNTFTFIPRSGAGNYTINVDLIGALQNGSPFQRSLARSLYIGDYVPPHIGAVEKVMPGFITAGLGKQVGNRSGVRCVIFDDQNNQPIANGYVTSVGTDQCTVKLLQNQVEKPVASGHRVELDLIQWQGDKP